MEPKVWLFIFLGLAFVTSLIGILVYKEKRTNNLVAEHSKKLRLLLALNTEISFYDISASIVLRKHYDNKSSFKKIEPAYLMTAELRANLPYYADYIAKIRENREKKIRYDRRVGEIHQSLESVPGADELGAIGLSLEQFQKRETAILQKYIIQPTLHCTFYVFMSYTSPKGQVHEEKTRSFSFEEMVVSFNSISRTRVDRHTYSQLAAVERGEISDSLRYDILRRDGFRCVICGASAEQGVTLHVDHIVPIAKGGKSISSNLRTLCERCNIGKSDKQEIVSDETPSTHSVADNDSVCPYCNGKLVLRRGKYGEFYGCSNYPKCKFTKKGE